ncbi:MAG: glycosyltransferase, partial [Chloroflexota bacterium]
GLARASAVLYPDDLAIFAEGKQTIAPVVHPAFTPVEDPFAEPSVRGFQVAETYILTHGPLGYEALQKTLDAWSWAAAPLSDFYPLYFLGLDAEARGAVDFLLQEYELTNTAHIFPDDLSPQELAVLYQHGAAYFHPGGVAGWGNPMRHAIACGRPAISVESSAMDALVGPAALLMDSSDAKVLGAGLISLIVKDVISEGLLEATVKHSAHWIKADKFVSGLMTIYNGLLNQH